MDEKRLIEIGEFLKEIANSSKPQEGEFSGIEFVKATGFPSQTARTWLALAEKKGILKSRKTSQYRLYSICNEEEWKKWLNQRTPKLQEQKT
jgi:hypothetical protein